MPMIGDVYIYVKRFFDEKDGTQFIVKVKVVEKEDGSREVIDAWKEFPTDNEVEIINMLDNMRN
jgi:hypothetical protein